MILREEHILKILPNRWQKLLPNQFTHYLVWISNRPYFLHAFSSSKGCNYLRKESSSLSVRRSGWAFLGTYRRMARLIAPPTEKRNLSLMEIQILLWLKDSQPRFQTGKLFPHPLMISLLSPHPPYISQKTNKIG